MIRALALVLLALAWGSPVARAAEDAPRPRAVAAPPPGVRVPAWNELSEAQRRDMAHLSARWDGLPAWRRVQILERWQRWQAVPPEQRETLRRGEANYRSLSPRLRAQMRRSLAAVSRLPPAEQRRLRARWRELDPEGRRAWLERGGPGIAPPPR